MISEKPATSPSYPPISAFQRFLLLVLPPPKSKIDYWEDDDSVSVTWTPSVLGQISGDRVVVRLYRRAEDGGWIDAERGLPANRWLAAEIDEHVRELRASSREPRALELGTEER